jgi:Protein of unknown function (DUF2433)
MRFRPNSENQRILLDKCLSVVERVPPPTQGGTAGEEPAWKNCWNWNLCDAAYGHLVLDIKDGRVSSELKSQGTTPFALFLFRLMNLSVKALIMLIDARPILLPP